VCQRLYVHFDEAHHEKCISSKPSDEVSKISKSSRTTSDRSHWDLSDLDRGGIEEVGGGCDRRGIHTSPQAVGSW
jgi:hypothetical protein